MDAQFRLLIGISTIGRRVAELDRLLRQLGDQVGEVPHQVVLCDQSDHAELLDLLSEPARAAISRRVTSSIKGLSAGRNACVEGEHFSHAWFPNDTSQVAQDFLARVAAVAGTAEVVAVRYPDETGVDRYPMPDQIIDLDARAAWRVIEPAMVVHRIVLERTGGFDETIGTGSAGPWQSGEGADLLLRAAAAGPLRVHFTSTAVVQGVSQGYGLDARERRSKAYRYGCGYGRVMRLHGYPRWKLLGAVMKPALLAVGARKGSGRRELLATARGRCRGALTPRPS